MMIFARRENFAGENLTEMSAPLGIKEKKNNRRKTGAKKQSGKTVKVFPLCFYFRAKIFEELFATRHESDGASANEVDFVESGAKAPCSVAVGKKSNSFVMSVAASDPFF